MTEPHGAPRPIPRVLCAGIAVRDLVFRVGAPPEVGTKTNASQYLDISGGNAANAAVGIARLGGKVAFAGPIGADKVGRDLVAELRGEGIDCANVVHVAGLTTPVSAILLDDAGERTITTYRDRQLKEVACPDPERAIEGCAIVSADNRFPTFVGGICAAARRRGIPVVLDGDSAATGTGDLMRLASHVIFSTEGLRGVTGLDDRADGLRRAAGETSAFVAVTAGGDGVIWLDESGDLRSMPAFPVRAVDTLAAGDVFHGAFALAIAEGRTTVAALRFAAAAAALKCTRIGGALATPRRADVEALLEG
jgi:sugar/nucleoside kinase (ribokinase family)